MTLWNDFTHYLDDPVNGDQEAQDESRNTGGGQAAFTLNHAFGAVENQFVAGVQLRDDQALVDKKHTLQQVPLAYCSVEGGNPDGSTAQVPEAGGICSAMKSTSSTSARTWRTPRTGCRGCGRSRGCARNTTERAITVCKATSGSPDSRARSTRRCCSPRAA